MSNKLTAWTGSHHEDGTTNRLLMPLIHVVVCGRCLYHVALIGGQVCQSHYAAVRHLHTYTHNSNHAGTRRCTSSTRPYLDIRGPLPAVSSVLTSVPRNTRNVTRHSYSHPFSFSLTSLFFFSRLLQVRDGRVNPNASEEEPLETAEEGLFTGRMPSRSPNQQCQSTEGYNALIQKCG